MQAVLVARFQIPNIDQELQDFLNSIAEKYDKVLLIIGESPIPGSKKNPFNVEGRKSLISKEYPGINILSIKDHPNDSTWSKTLDEIIEKNTSEDEVIILGSRDHFIPYYDGKFDTKETGDHFELSSSKVKNLYSDLEEKSADFRAGMSYAYHKTYDQVYPTVDVAIFRNNKEEILLGKKSINNKWRFIGGFVDPADDSFEAAAARELEEETGNIKVTDMKYVCTQKVNDWRYRFERDKIITTLFECDYISGDPTASDDISELCWFAVRNLQQMISEKEITPEHGTLFKVLLDKI